ncbi:osmoprotectant transport system permease protein [Kineosphaera limosa]|uniref:Putative ABC transporter permease protein n=1 Tax=Kineosphaera limosa NBRC 100340 TaxID=1184609 RepID=K6WJY0_9MICO|nr:ABC transporter permease subunit [Kineosphaera limosa]NYE02246.1 osmoprotectant transport system permease protein [Kineosphaera limosa]GAB94101.1 putative ABC transporter permease protein [Kineosphaera limosa NBRC 100340]
MTWFLEHLDLIGHYAWAHAKLAVVPLLVGLALAIPIGWLARQVPWLRAPLVAGTGLLYTLPSLAVFILLPGLIGTQILDPLNVLIAMTLYTIALLVRTVVDGLDAVPEDVRLAATAMGYRGVRRFVAVDLPLAVPVIAAGVRVAAVSNVSIVSVAALIGVQQLGSLFTDGFNRAFAAPIVVGLVACVLLALILDLLIVVTSRVLTPWTRARRQPGRAVAAGGAR